MISKDFFAALDELEKEKGINKEIFMVSLEKALGIACKKQYGEQAKVVVKINPDKATIRAYTSQIVVEEITEEEGQITLELAKEIKKTAKLDDEILTEIFPRDFGRIAAQNARQVIMNSLHDAEKRLTYDQYLDKESELLIGVVNRVNADGTIYVEIGKNQQQGVLSPMEQIPGEKYLTGDRIKVLVKKVKDTPSGAQIVLSRANHIFIKRLFENEVPEIRAGIVEVKSIVREAGFRTKMAVYSTDEEIDAVGACVGNKGVRVNSIVAEIGGEKIDIIPWSSDILDFIARALSPAKVLIVQADEAAKIATVVVPDEKLSLAIGKEGQNARLAAKLTNWKIDVKSYTSAINSGMFDDDEEEQATTEEYIHTDSVEVVE